MATTSTYVYDADDSGYPSTDFNWNRDLKVPRCKRLYCPKIIAGWDQMLVRFKRYEPFNTLFTEKKKVTDVSPSLTDFSDE